MKVIILAGGSGTRLFPLSRSCFPKQFLHIAGRKSLLQQTVERFKGVVSYDDFIIVTNDKYKFHVESEMQAIGAANAHIICEPVGRNTAPAIALAMSYSRDKLNSSDDETFFVTPSDHLIHPDDKFKILVKKAIQMASKGRIVTLGIEPTRPETGYGYIHAGVSDGDGYIVESFKEKPDYNTAEKYLQAGGYFWNGGMFVFSMICMTREMEKYAPDIVRLADESFEKTESSFVDMPDISIDYAVAEKSDKIYVLPMRSIYWNDIGSFDSISDVLSSSNGDALVGDILSEDCKNTMILGGNRLICGIGLQDLMVVDTPDVLLVAKKGESQKVRHLVEKLKSQGRKEISENVTMYRPWGSYTILAEGPGYKVKRIEIKPGGKLSLQLHYHRSEHWTVISGTGKCTLGDKTVIFRENESTYIPIGVKHRLENPGKIPMAIIEVQNGKYLGEDDIVRFDDIYGRTKK